MSAARAEAAARPERGRQFWTKEHLTSAPVLLVVATALLCVLGVVMVFSASSVEAVEEGASAWGEASSQALYMLIGLGLCLIVRAVGGSFWITGKMFYVLWGAVLVLLVLVLVLGDDSHGATRWISVGPFSLQPSEFAKIALVMSAARILAGWEHGQYSWRKAFAMMAFFVVLPFALILFQRDLGTLLIVGATIYLMAVLARVRIPFLVVLAVLCVAAVIVLIFAARYRTSRLTIWLDPYSDYYGDGWQPIHGLYAFASGGFFGLGLGNSRQKYSYLPEAENDYIFAIIGEELGFVGAVFVILLFVLLGWSGMRIAVAAGRRDRVSALMAAGLTITIEVQALLNMGGVLGVLPLSGRPLPFVSSGGSSAISCLLSVGLLLGVARDGELAAPEPRARALRAERPQLKLLDGGAPQPRSGRLPHDVAPPADVAERLDRYDAGWGRASGRRQAYEGADTSRAAPRQFRERARPDDEGRNRWASSR